MLQFAKNCKGKLTRALKGVLGIVQWHLVRITPVTSTDGSILY